jgi:hypothetical protein
MQSQLFLDVVIREHTTILHLLPRKNKSYHVWSAHPSPQPEVNEHALLIWGNAAKTGGSYFPTSPVKFIMMEFESVNRVILLQSHLQHFKLIKQYKSNKIDHLLQCSRACMPMCHYYAFSHVLPSCLSIVLHVSDYCYS